MEISDDIKLGTRITLQVSEGGCDDCFFAKLDYDLRVDCCYRIKCQATRRKDKKNVAFKLVESSATEPNMHIEHKKTAMNSKKHNNREQAIQGFLKGLWHLTNEMPKCSKWILTQFLNDDNDIVFDIDNITSLIKWKEYVKECRIIKWLYVDDILPQ